MKKTGYELKSQNIKIVPTDSEKLWSCDWNILLKNQDDKLIGTVTFDGEKQYGTVPITIKLEERYQNQGLGTECIKLMTDWAFLHKNVYEVKAVCDDENDKCIHALEKAGYVYRSREANIETYSITKQKSSYTGVYLIIGVIVGLILGIVFGNQWIGMAIGLIVSLLIGANLDAKENKDREKVIGKSIKD